MADVSTEAERNRAEAASQQAAAAAFLAAIWLRSMAGTNVPLALLAQAAQDRQGRGLPVTVWHVVRLPQFQSVAAAVRASLATFVADASTETERRQQVFARMGEEHTRRLLLVQATGVGEMIAADLTADGAITLVGRAADKRPVGRHYENAVTEEAAGLAGVLVAGLALGHPASHLADSLRGKLARGLDRALLIMGAATWAVYREAARLTAVAGGAVGYLRMAQKSPSTCIACLMADGRYYDISVPFEEHVNGRCLTPGTLVSGPVAESFVSRHYVGEIVEITTAAGNFLSVTPNHPVLTSRGWVAAQFLQEGDHVVSSNDGERIAAGIDPNEYQVPTVVENIPRSLNMERLAVVPVAAEDFHGDGVGSDVYVVWTNRLLSDGFDSALFEPLSEHDFRNGNMSTVGFARFGDFGPMFGGMLQTNAGLLSDTDAAMMLVNRGLIGQESVGVGLVATLNPGFAKTHSYDIARNSELSRERVLGFTGQVPGGNLVDGQGRPSQSSDRVFLALDDGALCFGSEQTASLEFIRKSLLVTVESCGSSLRTIAANVCLDRVLKINRAAFAGHVYNLQTREQWYIASNIVTHNCTMVPVKRRDARPDWETGEAWFRRQDAVTQRAILGPGRYAAWRNGRRPLGAMVRRVVHPSYGASLHPTPLRELLAE